MSDATMSFDPDQFFGGSSSEFKLPKEAESRGWKQIITIVSTYPQIYQNHIFSAMPGQSKVKDNKTGAMVDRGDKLQFGTCLGSPRKPFGKDGFVIPELDPEGVELCQSIKLPDGSCLHDHDHNFPNSRFTSANPWTFVFAVYNHGAKRFQYMRQSATNPMVKLLLLRRSEYAEPPQSYAFSVQYEFLTQKRTPRVERIALPGPIPNPTQGDKDMQDNWKFVQNICNPYETAESVVARLGIEKWNPQYAPGYNEAPASAATTPAPDGGGNTAEGWWNPESDDPFGDGPTTGSMTNARENL